MDTKKGTKTSASFDCPCPSSTALTNFPKHHTTLAHKQLSPISGTCFQRSTRLVLGLVLCDVQETCERNRRRKKKNFTPNHTKFKGEKEQTSGRNNGQWELPPRTWTLKMPVSLYFRFPLFLFLVVTSIRRSIFFGLVAVPYARRYAALLYDSRLGAQWEKVLHPLSSEAEGHAPKETHTTTYERT